MTVFHVTSCSGVEGHACCLPVTLPTIPPWKCRQYMPPNRVQTCTRLAQDSTLYSERRGDLRFSNSLFKQSWKESPSRGWIRQPIDFRKLQMFAFKCPWVGRQVSFSEITTYAKDGKKKGVVIKWRMVCSMENVQLFTFWTFSVVLFVN
jgi:hypothetical protein